MKIVSEPMPGLKLLEPEVYSDSRGFFLETYNSKKFQSLGISDVFVQDNQSLSSFGTIRGLHYQIGDFAQSKLVMVPKGKVLDVVVDLRKSSPTFKKAYSVELSEENKLIFYVPRGFAHGFATLSPQALFCYKCDNLYSSLNERGIHFNDPDLMIDWKISDTDILISPKDGLNPFLRDIVL